MNLAFNRTLEWNQQNYKNPVEAILKKILTQIRFCRIVCLYCMLTIPVSYTHLDVYKRQHCALCLLLPSKIDLYYRTIQTIKYIINT